MVHVTINGKAVSVPEGTTILDAARSVHIDIPTLCYLKDVHQYGSCRICVVEVEGMKNLQASCMAKVREGMVIHTNSAKVRRQRKLLYELMLSNHSKDCLSCARNQNCELQALGERLGVSECRLEGERTPRMVDCSPSITRDTSKCILCRRCVTACKQIQHVGAIDAQNRGFDTVISPALGLPLNSTACAMCGQCVLVCPTGALQETDGLTPVWKALQDPKKRVVVQTAPAVRAALGEAFGYPVGTPVTGKMVSALRELGFDDVFDTNFAADLTILEEGTELLHRLSDAATGKGAVLPMITSCSPGWIKHIEHAYPDQLPHLSTCKSPHTMLGAVIKSFYAQRLNIDPQDLYVVSIMPCTAKKYEVQRPEMGHDGLADVDAVLTTRELARMIKSAGIDIEGLEQIKTASITIENTLPDYAYLEGVTVRIAVTSGLAGADVLMDELATGASPYHFIEVMGCPGGCINGGGQPRCQEAEYREKRARALYSEDERKVLRKSHENPALQALYQEYLQSPGSHLAHELLHTHYTPRGLHNERLK